MDAVGLQAAEVNAVGLQAAEVVAAGLGCWGGHSRFTGC